MRENIIYINIYIYDKYIFYIFDTHLCNTTKTQQQEKKSIMIYFVGKLTEEKNSSHIKCIHYIFPPSLCILNR